MALVCPKKECGKPLRRDADGKLPERCPHCGAAFRARKMADAGSRLPSRTDAAALLDVDPNGRVEDAAPFGDPFAPLASRTSIGATASAGAAQRRSLILLTLGVVGIGIGVAIWLLVRNSGAATAAGNVKATTFQNVGRNYSFALDSAIWRADEARAQALAVDLAFAHRSGSAWLLVASEEARTAAASLDDLAAAAQRWVELGMTEFTPVSMVDCRLANQPAKRVSLSGKLDGQPADRQAIVAFAQGIVYRVALFRTATAERDALADFAAALPSFQLLAERPNWRESLRNPSNLVEFRSGKFPYLLRAARDAWKEAPDLPIASRYADLKLIDKTKQANVVVSPRETRNLDAFRDAYIARVQREFDGKNVAVRRAERDMKIRGRPAQKIVLEIAAPTGDFVLDASFLEVEPYIYQIECRAPAAQAASFEPAFQAIIESFETVALASPPKATASMPLAPKDEPPKARPPESPAKSTATKNPMPQAKPETGGTAEKKPAKTDAKEKAKKRKSLDDLD